MGEVYPPPLAYAYAPTEENKKGVRKFSARFLAFSNEISTVQKIVLSSSQGQGYFRGLEPLRSRPRASKCVLEAKDVLEDSTSDSAVLEPRTGHFRGLAGFEAMAKNFKLCPRGRPGATGGHSGAVPPNDCVARTVPPKKLTGSGLLECKLRPKTPKFLFTAHMFVIFVNSHRISIYDLSEDRSKSGSKSFEIVFSLQNSPPLKIPGYAPG